MLTILTTRSPLCMFSGCEPEPVSSLRWEPDGEPVSSLRCEPDGEPVSSLRCEPDEELPTLSFLLLLLTRVSSLRCEPDEELPTLSFLLLLLTRVVASLPAFLAGRWASCPLLPSREAIPPSRWQDLTPTCRSIKRGSVHSVYTCSKHEAFIVEQFWTLGR
jgi:hypothetical protein